MNTSANSGLATRARRPRLFAHAILIAATMVMAYPLLWTLSSSFKPDAEIFSNPSLWPQQFTFENYVNGWSALGVGFARFFANSTFIAVMCVIGNVLTCSLVAFCFAFFDFPGRKMWFGLMLGTLMLPYHVTLVPQYILFMNFGWIDTYLPLIVPHFLATDAFFIFLLVQFFRGMPRELFEAAVMDGCSKWRIYYRIILPLSLPALATTAVFSFIWSWEDFFGPLIYVGKPENYTVSLALRTFVDSTSQSSWGALFAMSILSLLPVLFLFAIFQRLLIQGIATSGLKA